MKKALLVGINSYSAAPLKGCVNDITDVAAFLTSSCGFSMDEIRLLADGRATTDALNERLNWLVDGAAPGDSIFFHYSGHGTQMATRDHQGEIDGLDEVICPVDFDWTDPHVIRDKDFHRIFSAIPEGCNFIWISDSCHSQDLTRDLIPDTLPRSYPVPADILWGIEAARSLDLKPMGLSLSLATTLDLNLAMVSGCKSNQTSADSVFNGKFRGALTNFLLEVLSEVGFRDSSLDMLIEEVKDRLSKTKKFTQIPGVEGSPAVIKQPFFKS